MEAGLYGRVGGQPGVYIMENMKVEALTNNNTTNTLYTMSIFKH